MKTSTKKSSHIHGLFNLLMALGLITLLFGPLGDVKAQKGNPAAPLSPQLTWTDLGPTERALMVNGQSVTLSGITYKAGEEFNLENSDKLATYYSTTRLA